MQKDLFTIKLRYIRELLCRRPDAMARICGDSLHNELHGCVYFYCVNNEVLVVSEIFGLPVNPCICASSIHAYHIHEGTSCTGTECDPFAAAGGHYNPHNCEHPHHAGDMPPLFGANGYAFQAFVTDRFNLCDIIGRVVIIHESYDDFTTQPSGNAGAKIACGQIVKCR